MTMPPPAGRSKAILAGATLALFGSLAAPLAAQAPRSGYIPHRVHDTAAEVFIDFEMLAARAAEANVVFFGEFHDDPGTHRLQHALLEALARRGVDVVLSLEMFERDVQQRLDDYLAGRIDEDEFLDGARPWSNYATDYRPLVEFARSQGWPVLAANVPRPLAARVAREGLATLDTLEVEARPWIAREMHCPRDEYFERFAEAMGQHSVETQSAKEMEAMTWRFYEAQCVKDETMAESIAQALESMPGRVIVHMNGSFHSDFGLGTVSRLRSRAPDAETMILSALPIEDLDWPPITENAGRADVLVFTVRQGPGDLGT